MNESKLTMAAQVASSEDNPFDRLPFDVLEKILGLDAYDDIEDMFKLPFRQFRLPDLNAGINELRTVCKLFASLLSNERLLGWELQDAEDGTALLEFISKADVGVKWNKLGLKIHCSFDIELFLPAATLYFCDTLESISIVFKPKPGWQASWDIQVLVSMLRSCRKLRHAFFDSCHLGSHIHSPAPSGVGSLSSSLGILHLENLEIMKASDLEELLMGLPNLRDLFINIERFESANPCVLKSSSLKSLIWSDGETSDTKVEFNIPSLKCLTLQTGLVVRLLCPSLAYFKYYLVRSLESLLPMWGLEELIVEYDLGTNLCEILAVSPNLKTLEINYKYNPGWPLSFPHFGRLCESLIQLRLGPDAWDAICSAIDVTTVRDDVFEPRLFFQKLERIVIELSPYIETDDEWVELSLSLSKLKVVLAACKRLKQVGITFWPQLRWYEDVWSTGILTAVKALSQASPSCWFVVEDRRFDPQNQRIVVIRSSRTSLEDGY